ncbi:MAG: phosphoribosylanthranilate isomerase, partial [Paracoccus sp. (in: a-proteobacteria)]
PRKVYDITRRLPPEILTVGVFRNEHPDLVVKHAHEAGVKAVQLHGRETPAQTQQIAKHFRWVIKVFDVGSEQLTRAVDYGTQMIMIDTPKEHGGGKVFDWELASDAPSNLDLILAGGLHPDNVAAAIEAVEPWGVDVASGVEASPGRKDPTLVRRFINNARAAAPRPYLGDDEFPYDWADE